MTVLIKKKEKGMIIAKFHDIQHAREFAAMMNEKYSPTHEYETKDTSGNEVLVEADDSFCTFEVVITTQFVPMLSNCNTFVYNEIRRLLPASVAEAWIKYLNEKSEKDSLEDNE